MAGRITRQLERLILQRLQFRIAIVHSAVDGHVLGPIELVDRGDCVPKAARRGRQRRDLIGFRGHLQQLLHGAIHGQWRATSLSPRLAGLATAAAGAVGRFFAPFVDSLAWFVDRSESFVFEALCALRLNPTSMAAFTAVYP